MDIHVVSIFPQMFHAITEQGVISRAIQRDVLSLSMHNPRDYANDKHRSVDAKPYGGGAGMLMRADVMADTIGAAKTACQQAQQRRLAKASKPIADSKPPKVIYLSPQGQRFSHAVAQRFATQEPALVLLAGRYQGIDERVINTMVDEQWSIGDYVLSGGELPAMVMIDAIARLLPNSLGNDDSAQQDSFAQGLLDGPRYTKPALLAGQAVPDVLCSGDHQAIQDWRMKQSLGRTWLRRPELLEKINLTEQQIALLEEFKRDLLKDASA